MKTPNEGWRKRMGRNRRALETKVAVTCVFATGDLEAIGYAIGRDEPTRHDLRRWITAVVRRALADATERAGKANKPEELDVPF